MNHFARVRRILIPLFLACGSTSGYAPDSAGTSRAWDVTAPHGPTHELKFTTEEGTWISLDVSPDGKRIAFDLLGDIYSMPVEGGRATLLSGGPAYETQPRFSPDGTRISFTSDRGGGDNIWVMNPLENIRNSDSVRFVMLNGRLYDAATMNQTGNHPSPRGKFYWEWGKDPGGTTTVTGLE